MEQSKIIAKYLFESADNPRIKFGELVICYFNECLEEDESKQEKIRIFKF